MRIEDVSERIAMGPFGSSIKVETFVDTGVPVISGQHLRGLMLDDSKFNFLTEEHARRLLKAEVHRGDVIFTHAGSIGQAAFIPEESQYQRYVISQRQFFMRCKSTLITPSYVALYFNTAEGQHKLLANTSSSGVPSIARPVSYLRSINIPVPPFSVLSEFERIVTPLLSKHRRNQGNSATLAHLRDQLLPKLISGEIRLGQEEERA
jgi:type I restriction enzyme S subunit